jgi:tRNA (guanine37-N1)-methyltransferase
VITRRIWILTLFPEFFQPLLACGIAGQALRGERAETIKFEVKIVNIRDWGMGNYHAVDDTPYGGGPGMVMRADVLAEAFKEGVLIPGGYQDKSEFTVIYTGPRGVPWNNQVARSFGEKTLTDKDIVFICGRYEGIDERFLTHYVDQTFSLGDYVLTGGELAVMTMLDSSVRFVPGILGNKSSANEDSFEDGLLECPQYTKPREFEGAEVPEVLANGNHAKIKEWQQSQKELMTKTHRPDLLADYSKSHKAKT